MAPLRGAVGVENVIVVYVFGNFENNENAINFEILCLLV